MEHLSLLTGALANVASSVGLDEKTLGEMTDVFDPRFFFVVNNTSTSSISYFLAGLSVLAVFGLLLIILFFTIGFLNEDLGLFRRHDVADTYSSYAGPGVVDGFHQQQHHHLGHQQPPQSVLSDKAATPLQSRTLLSGYDAINVLYMLEEAFQKLELSDFECQQRVICEAHESGAEQRYGSLASKLQNIIGSADLQTLDNTDSDASHVFKLFRNAAINGIQRSDCAATYAGRCTNGLRELARKSYKL